MPTVLRIDGLQFVQTITHRRTCMCKSDLAKALRAVFEHRTILVQK
jgi:hypothetical protein